MAYKQKPITFGEGTGDPKVKSTDYLTKTPSIVASKGAKQDYESTDGSNDSEEDNDKETVRINTIPVTTPRLFSDNAHSKTKKKVDKNKKNSKEANKQERIEDAEGK